MKRPDTTLATAWPPGPIPPAGDAERLADPPAVAGPVLFDLRDVDLDYGRVAALRGIRLAIHTGERVALVGANGSGKSTLLRVLHGLLAPTAGTARCLPRNRQALVFQRPHMLRTSVQNNVALGLWLRGMGWRRARQAALEALARVEMAELARRNAKALSGGQQQRVALAHAWAMEPEALLLDEPTANLDPHAKREVEALMQEFARPRAGRSMTMVFSSHNLGQVKRLASRVVYLERGRILADLPVHRFFNGPLPEEAHLFVKGEKI
ncbi:MAG: phosphate ABC transporter ATP-binding protein [Pigmentiphaga sp.]|uniref:ABC transporter ATP-binding protein n=1 Tax=Pigmentiphaga sp. TaxID=1977564 RepID=UPI0029BE299B|nr:phosphate ABC transporter ATP-binding protein [Pigmentiphaga sp.]MDX3906524.1 phosphate ABC transporter ATP-binding protein [Pigmentiphaga sp.]